jgi:N-hydroxyarylamine O-acetyltransferase
MDVAAYLERIGYNGSATPTLEVLRALHLHHLQAVPFENLDISRSRKIVLDSEALVRKVVEERRGGFCYELNASFAALLRAIGFRVTLLSARAFGADGSEAPEFDHLALRVDLDEAWLADVGFGDSFVEPLRLSAGVEQQQSAGVFRIIDSGTSLRLQRQQPGGVWKSEFAFTLTPRELNDFAEMCHYHQTSPKSHFTQNRICSRAIPTGRITLSGLKLILTENGNRQESMLESEEDWRRALEHYFGIML